MSESSTNVVGLVVDPEFGERLGVLVHEIPLWVISSVTNDPAIEAARTMVDTNRITKLFARDGEDGQSLLRRAMCAIDEHHGEESGTAPYRSLRIYGATCSPPGDLASDLGFRSVMATPYGFKVEK